MIVVIGIRINTRQKNKLVQFTICVIVKFKLSSRDLIVVPIWLIDTRTDEKIVLFTVYTICERQWIKMSLVLRFKKTVFGVFSLPLNVRI